MFRKLVYGLVACHLTVVTLVIFHGLDNDKLYRALEKPLACLTAVNYSAWRFAFFTPDIGKSTDLQIHMSGKGGKELRYSTLEGFDFFTSNKETENRFYGYKVHSAKDSLFIDLSARSVCTYMLNEHPEMDRIKYIMRGILYPEMREFRNDSTIIEAEFYRIEFEL